MSRRPRVTFFASAAPTHPLLCRNGTGTGVHLQHGNDPCADSGCLQLAAGSARLAVSLLSLQHTRVHHIVQDRSETEPL